MSERGNGRGVIKRGPLNEELHKQFLWWAQNKKAAKLKAAREWLRRRVASDPAFAERRRQQYRDSYKRKRQRAESCRDSVGAEEGIRVISKDCGAQ